jgi:hypothetical protein
VGGNAAAKMAQESRIERVRERHPEAAALGELKADKRRTRARFGRQAGALISGRGERAQELGETEHLPRILITHR